VDVTPAAVAELSLDPGSQVWLTVKATELEVYSHSGAQAGLSAGDRGTATGRDTVTGIHAERRWRRFLEHAPGLLEEKGIFRLFI